MTQSAIVLHPYIKSRKRYDSRSAESKLEEAVGLALAIDLEIILAQVVQIQDVVPGKFFGGGKVEELADFVEANEVGLVIVNDKLTPIQQRNLENAWKCKVIDRTALILEIFGERANTKEGRLQVDLAAQEYQKSRLVRSWTHLERQRGGGGFMGGPGEKQIESDRRALRERISSLKKQLKKVVQTRQMHRKSRQKVPYPVVALVGYTNAGKSTLFNKLTGAKVMAEDKLFATLDPTMRLVKLPSGKKIILSDTVGFISDLPTELVAAFRATLEEVTEADIILHVRDIANPDTEEQKKDVISVLCNLGLENKMVADMVEVRNKIDLLEGDEAENLLDDNVKFVGVSALTGDGLDKMLVLIDNMLARGERIEEIEVSTQNGQVIAWIYAHAKVISAEENDGVMCFRISISEMNWGKLRKIVGN